MSSCEEVIIEILKESKCVGQDNMITPDDLIEKCAFKGITSSEEVGAAIVSLIDQDVVDYEMDADLKTSELWLM
jgi:hypothetical protein